MRFLWCAVSVCALGVLGSSGYTGDVAAQEAATDAVVYRFPDPDDTRQLLAAPAPPITPGSDKLGRAMERALAAQNGEAALAPVMSGGLSPDEAFAIGAGLSRRGLSLLSTKEQIARMQLLDRLLSRLNPSECIAWTTGGFGAINAKLQSALDSADLDAFANASVRSMILAAQNRNKPAPQLEPPRVLQLIENVTGALPAAHQQRFSNAVYNPPAGASTDPCWAQRVMYAYALQQPDSRRPDVVAFVTLLESSTPVAAQ